VIGIVKLVVVEAVEKWESRSGWQPSTEAYAATEVAKAGMSATVSGSLLGFPQGRARVDESFGSEIGASTFLGVGASGLPVDSSA
jgi:hypothetical protein